jgi:cytochrome c peroxidase
MPRVAVAAFLVGIAAAIAFAGIEDPKKLGIGSADPVHETFMPVVPQKPFAEAMKADVQGKAKVLARQRERLAARYDLASRPSPVMMSGGRRAVQQGVRVKLAKGATWDQLASMSPDDVRAKQAFPAGFLPLPHVNHATGGMVFPEDEIEAIQRLEQRSLRRFDVDFDLPEHFLPEFPPPLFLTTHPELGDVTKGRLLSIDNYYEILHGLVTPVQLEGMRLLLTPFPQQQFNQTDDRKVERPSLGVACLDCHSNGHTNGAFHLNPDTRPQIARLRIETVSLRGLFNQQIHGSKRSLRSVEDFTEFEQRTAYFDGDQVTAAKKGVHLPDRASQVALMAQMQIMFDFPPAPKLDAFGRLDAARGATEQELRGEAIFFGKGRCGGCHPAPFYLDHLMHDLRTERFFEPHEENGAWIHADGPIKTFTLRGIKDSPPYLHDGRLLTLEDTVEFFNLVLGTKLTAEEKADLTAFLRVL